MATSALHRPLRWSVAALILAGALLAAASAVIAFARMGVRDGAVFTVVAVALILVAVGFARDIRWVVALVIIVYAGQVGAIVGTIFELVYGVAPSKAVQLRELGFDPVIGICINLAYSAAAFALFCWFLIRWFRLRRRGRTLPSGTRLP